MLFQHGKEIFKGAPGVPTTGANARNNEQFLQLGI